MNINSCKQRHLQEQKEYFYISLWTCRWSLFNVSINTYFTNIYILNMLNILNIKRLMSQKTTQSYFEERFYSSQNPFNWLRKTAYSKLQCITRNSSLRYVSYPLLGPSQQCWHIIYYALVYNKLRVFICLLLCICFCRRIFCASVRKLYNLLPIFSVSNYK